MVSATSNGATTPAGLRKADVESFQQYLSSSKRILALLGAGLSASSGLPTFRGAGGLWRQYEATELATPEAFQRDPSLVWQFYNYRRHMALKAKPNPAHYALAELAKKHPAFMTLSQNVDGLSQRAGHPLDTLKLLHGSLFTIRCTNFYCTHVEQNNFTDPIAPALAIPTVPASTTSSSTSTSNPNGTQEATQADMAAAINAQAAAHHTPAQDVDISDHRVELDRVPIDQLPQCPECTRSNRRGLLRPGVVWFGEMLPRRVLDDVESFLNHPDGIDLIMVIGTSSKVYPAAGYVDEARDMGARVAVINMSPHDAPAGGLQRGDWGFWGDAAKILPEILEEYIGPLPEPEERVDVARA